MSQKEFDEYPVIGTAKQFISLLAAIAARNMNDPEVSNDGTAIQPAN